MASKKKAPTIYENKVGYDETVTYTRSEIMAARGWTNKKGKKK